MPSGIRETTKPQLEIYLEKPWGGVAADADPVDILDNQFVSGQGIIDVDGQLCQVNATADPTAFLFSAHTTGAIPLIIFNLAGKLYSVDQFGAVYQLDIITLTSTRFDFIADASDGPWPGVNTFIATMAVQVLNGLAYIGVPFRHSIYTFNGVTGLQLASNYTGGSIMGTVDDYLLQMNTNSAIDGQKPTRVNWSSPGAFSTWDPAIDRSAGFDTLVNIEDAITGFISLATVGIIIGQKGLVEMSPTGVGIKPFSFNALWTSEVGQGILYPNTVSQYGQSTFAATDTGAYKISTAGFTEISDVVDSLMLGVVQESALQFPSATRDIPPLFAGNVLLYAFNSSYPTPYYVFATTTPQTAAGQRSLLILWFFNIKNGTWFYQILDFINLVNAQNGTSFTDLEPSQLKIASVSTLGFPSSANGFNTLPNLLIYGSGVNPGDATAHCFIAPIYIFNKKNVTTALNTPSALAIASKSWEMKLGRKPTVRRILVKAYGSGTLNISVNDIDFGQITLDGTTTSKVYKSAKGVCTEEAPQIVITSSNFKGVIIKFMAAGTYADGDID